MKKDIQATNTTDKKTKNSKRRNLLTAALALALGAALFAPLMSGPASASLDDGRFCIRASSEAGKFEDITGGCGAMAPEVPVTPAPVEPTPEPQEPEVIEKLLIRQLQSVTVQGTKWLSKPWSLKVTLEGGKSLDFEGTTTSTGYMSQDAVFDQLIPEGEGYEIAPLRVDFVIGADSFSWAVPTDAQKKLYHEPGEQAYLAGEVDEGYHAGMIHFVDGQWKLPSGVTQIK